MELRTCPLRLPLKSGSNAASGRRRSVVEATVAVVALLFLLFVVLGVMAGKAVGNTIDRP